MQNKASLALRLAALSALAVGGARAGTSEKDRSWQALIAAAQTRGGVETKLDQTASYVFRQEDGAFVTLTRALKTAKRFICLVDKDSKASVCVDWDSGKTFYGERADAASPWKTKEGATLDEVEKDKPGPLGSLLKGIGDFIARGPK